MFKKLMLIASVMVLSSPFTYAVNPDEKPDAPLSLRGGGKKDSSEGGEVVVAREYTFPQFKKLEAALKGQVASFLEPRQRAHLAGMSKDDRAAMHLTEKEYLSEYLKRGESHGEAVASPMLYLIESMGMREQTVVFGPGSNAYLHHTAYQARTQVMKIALATTLTGKLTVASIKGDIYKTLVDIARVRENIVQCFFSNLLPTAFEGGNTAFLPGLHHKYASYRVFGTEDQIARFQTHMNGQISVLKESIALEYIFLEEAHINTKANYIVIEQDILAAKRAALGYYFAANSEKILLIDALNETLQMGAGHLPENVSHLAFSNTRHNLTTIGDDFLSWYRGLRTVDLSGISNLTTVGNVFLQGCRSLTEVDLSGLANVRTIAHGFLSSCSGLETVDLSALANVTTVDDSFLSDCYSLQTVDFSPLANLTTVGNSFISYCRGLTVVDLTPLASVTTVGDNFLSRCNNLTSIDLSPLVNITTVGNMFLSGYTGVTPIDPHGLIDSPVVVVQPRCCLL